MYSEYVVDTRSGHCSSAAVDSCDETHFTAPTKQDRYCGYGVVYIMMLRYQYVGSNNTVQRKGLRECCCWEQYWFVVPWLLLGSDTVHEILHSKSWPIRKLEVSSRSFPVRGDLSLGYYLCCVSQIMSCHL